MIDFLQSQQGLLVELVAASISDDVVVDYVRGAEAISELFEFEVIFQCSNRELDAEKILGTVATIHFHSEEHEKFIDGIITKFSQGTTSLKDDIYVTEYSLIINPKLWLLTLDRNCKIFQNKTTIDIIKSVLSDNKITDVSDKTSKCGKNTREYCVQYNESSFNFISRLMEDEGIFYYFSHEKGKHTLTLVDSPNSYEKISKDVEFIKNYNDVYPLGKVFNTSMNSFMHVGGYSLADYNYQLSQTKLFNKLDSKWKGNIFYEYPGGFAKTNEGESLSKLRVQEIESRHLFFEGDSTVTSFTSGYSFTLKSHHNEKFNDTYILYRVEHIFNKSDKSGFSYRNKFLAFPKDTEFRAPRKTPKPKIYGNQTAVVVCPSGKEIFRNEHCCVKVHFHWDQEGKNKDTDDSSCWIRVAQLLSGSNWGAIFIPRVGQEVVVSFLEGDPDRPLIVGCVYNDQFMPPYSDSEDMLSTLKTVTFTDDSGFNEFRFNDEKDKEEIFVHAQKDMYVDIINSRKTEIEESDDTLDIFKGSRTTTLHAQGDNPGNYSLELKKGDKSVLLDEGNSTYTLKKGNSTIQMDEGNSSITLKKGNSTIQMDEGNSTITLKKGDSTVKLEKGNQTIDITGDCTIKISGDLKIKADGNISLESGKDFSIKSGTNFQVKAGTAAKIESGTDFSCKAGTQMKLEATMNLNIKANMNVDVKATMMFSAQGTISAKISGTMAEVSGNAMTKISAPMVSVGGGMVKLG